MYSFGTLRNLVSGPVRPTFVRDTRRRLKPARLLAALPLMAVAVFTAGGSAPAEVPPAIQMAAAAQPEGRWSIDAARDLLEEVERSAEEGLNPADYSAAQLRAAIDAKQKGPALDAIANASALRLAHDYADGRIDDKAAFDWHIAPPIDPSQLAAGLDTAVAADSTAKWLRDLLPQHDQYRALKAAYAEAQGDEALRGQLRANLERWRWMPRDLGQRYIYVNIPSYRLELIRDGMEEAAYNVVVGSPKTPTPQLALYAQSVVANPAWILPPSVLKEGGWQRKGYQISRRADGSLMVRQAPGLKNALGRIKIDMPNPMAIYLHDTPNKAAFARTDRALSHGCVRVQNIEELAALLHDGGELDEALADPATTKTLQLQQSMPVYIVYFTAQADADGTVRLVGDPYRRDAQMISRLGNPTRTTTFMAAR